MTIRSLGFRTDLLFARFDGQVIDQGHYTVIRTPSNPTFHWGNFLLFADPPGAGDLDRWRELFAREIGTPPVTRHLAFGWDTTTGDTGEIQPFLDAGFRLNESVVLTARRVQPPPRPNREVAVRPLTEAWEWQGALENQIACADPVYDGAGYVEFKTRQMERYRAMTRAGLGTWFGAFQDGRVVADLGVYAEGGVGRYQTVGTHPDFRRRGICGTLVYAAARHAFEVFGVETLVIVADPDYHAAPIYRSVGFEPTERQAGMDWWERQEAGEGPGSVTSPPCD